MLFRFSNNRLDFESIDNGQTVLINFWNTNGNSQGNVRLNENELKALRDWINKQLCEIERSIKPSPKPIKK